MEVGFLQIQLIELQWHHNTVKLHLIQYSMHMVSIWKVNLEAIIHRDTAPRGFKGRNWLIHLQTDEHQSLLSNNQKLGNSHWEDLLLYLKKCWNPPVSCSCTTNPWHHVMIHLWELSPKKWYIYVTSFTK